jgi:hypothetical protein
VDGAAARLAAKPDAEKFSASRNLIIDIDPAFPWQITALDGYGGELQLVKNRSWGVWSGSATLNAAAATFNRIDVRRPSLKLSANASTVNINELSAFTERGILQATAAVSQPAAPGQPEPERPRRAAEYSAGLGLARAAGFRRR